MRAKGGNSVLQKGSPELGIRCDRMTVGNDREKTEKVDRGHLCFAKDWTCQQWEPRDTIM